MTRTKLAALFVALYASIPAALIPPEACAQPAQVDERKQAQRLLDGATDLYKVGDYARARRLIERALELVPTSSGALIALGMCLEKLDLLGSASARFAQAEQHASERSDRARQQEARARREALEPKLSRITIDVSALVAATPGLEIALDGVRIDPLKWGSAQPVDPGEHTVTATATGRSSRAQTISIDRNGLNRALVIDPLTTLPPKQPEQTTRATPSPAKEPTPSAPPSRIEPERSVSTLLTVGVVIGATGAISLGGGLVSGAIAMAKKADSDASCNGNVCAQTGLELRSSGTIAGDLSTGLFIAGGVLLTGGATLFLLSGRDQKAAAKVVVGPSGVAVRGVF